MLNCYSATLVLFCSNSVLLSLVCVWVLNLIKFVCSAHSALSAENLFPTLPHPFWQIIVWVDDLRLTRGPSIRGAFTVCSPFPALPFFQQTTKHTKQFSKILYWKNLGVNFQIFSNILYWKNLCPTLPTLPYSAYSAHSALLCPTLPTLLGGYLVFASAVQPARLPSPSAISACCLRLPAVSARPPSPPAVAARPLSALGSAAHRLRPVESVQNLTLKGGCKA